MNLMDLCPVSPLEIPSAIPSLGMTLPMAITKQDIETLAVLIRKNAEKTKVIVTQTLSALDHLFVNITAVSFPEDSVDTLAAANSLVEPTV